MPYPQVLRNDTNNGRLEIVWNDDTTRQFGAALLRRQCPCADCKSLRQKTGNELVIQTPVSIATIQLVGMYAVNIIFSDGHERGIFPWSYLKDLSTELHE